jgi:hypothetical protein
MSVNKLAAQTQKTAGIPNGMRTCTVAAVSSAGAITLAVNGGLVSSGVGSLKSYNPVVGDTVGVFRQDASWLVLGSTAQSLVNARGQLTGTISLTFTSAVSFSSAVNFGATFTQPPVVAPNIDSGAGPTARWCARAISITTTGFSMFVFAADGVAATWASVPVSWTATARS